jgi:uncharacterized membrane protein
VFDPDGVNQVQGENLRRLIEEVRRVFFMRSASRQIGETCSHINSISVVAIEVYEALSTDARLAIVADVMRAAEDVVLERDSEEIVSCSDTARSFIADLLCEIVYQDLMNDPLVMAEEESRQALTE